MNSTAIQRQLLRRMVRGALLRDGPHGLRLDRGQMLGVTVRAVTLESLLRKGLLMRRSHLHESYPTYALTNEGVREAARLIEEEWCATR